MKPITSFNAASSQVATHPIHVLKLQWTGDASAAAGSFLQVHDLATTPADGAVPLESWQLNAGAPDYKEFKNGELDLANGLYICVSSTEATKTLSASKFSMLNTEFTDPEFPSGTTFVGDLTTARETLLVWSAAAGLTTAKRLMAIRITSAGGFAAQPTYLQLHCADTPVTASIVAVIPIPTINDTTVKNYAFGEFGRECSKIVSNAVARGCTIAMSQTPNTYTAWGANEFIIKAEYK